MSDTRQVLVPAGRMVRWVAGVADRHGPVTLRVVDGALHGAADDGSWFAAVLPFGSSYGGPAEVAAFGEAAQPPQTWGVLLVRKGGFAVARAAGGRVVASKTGQRHVQGRTKAGGQSQRRFARRRENQARDAYRAAADHAARILRPGPLVVGGDRGAVEEVLGDPRLAGLEVVGPWLAVPDPRRRVLDEAVADAMAVVVEIHNA